MGYHAYGCGQIELTKSVNDPEIVTLIDKLCESSSVFTLSELPPSSLDIEHDYGWNYWEDEVYDMLGVLASYTKSGEIYFSGEDNESWKFVFDPDSREWIEYGGEVIYVDTLKMMNNIVQAFNKYVSYDSERTETSYVREMLMDVCGLDEKALKYCGLDWVFCDDE